MGFIFAIFQSVGGMPVSNDCLKLWNRIGPDTEMVFLIILELMPSTPQDVDSLRLLKRHATASTVIFVGVVCALSINSMLNRTKHTIVPLSLLTKM